MSLLFHENESGWYTDEQYNNDQNHTELARQGWSLRKEFTQSSGSIYVGVQATVKTGEHKQIRLIHITSYECIFDVFNIELPWIHLYARALHRVENPYSSDEDEVGYPDSGFLFKMDIYLPNLPSTPTWLLTRKRGVFYGYQLDTEIYDGRTHQPIVPRLKNLTIALKDYKNLRRLKFHFCFYYLCLVCNCLPAILHACFHTWDFQFVREWFVPLEGMRVIFECCGPELIKS
jgi:hypothetical protein